MIGDVVEARSRQLGLQRGNSVYIGRAVFLSKGQACRGVLPKEDLPDQKYRRLGYRHCWSGQDSAHGHSQMQILLYWTVFAVALAANEARREELAWCVRICEHQRPKVIWHSYPHCRINPCPDQDVCQVSPKMLWIHYLVGVSHFAKFSKNRTEKC